MFILFLPLYLYFCSDTGDSSGPGGLGQGQRNANSCRSLPQGSFWHLWDPVLAQDQTGVWGFCGPDCFMPVTPNVLSDYLTHVSMPCPLPQGESFREVMRRIQTMLEIQEKEFEKVRQRTATRQWFPLNIISWNKFFLLSFHVKPQRHSH